METIYLLPPFHLTSAIEILASIELFGAPGFLGETAQSYDIQNDKTWIDSSIHYFQAQHPSRSHSSVQWRLTKPMDILSLFS